MDDNRGANPHNVRMKYWVLTTMLILAGCDSAHPATSDAREFLTAVQYDDIERAFGHHMLSADASRYCEDSFVRIIDRVKQDATDRGCQEARAVTAGDVEGLGDEAQLIAQVTRTVCENPTIDCIGYSRRVFESVWESRPEIRGYEIKKVLGDENEAAAYVDLDTAEGLDHRTIKLVTDGDKWIVESGFFRGE